MYYVFTFFPQQNTIFERKKYIGIHRIWLKQKYGICVYWIYRNSFKDLFQQHIYVISNKLMSKTCSMNVNVDSHANIVW